MKLFSKQFLCLSKFCNSNFPLDTTEAGQETTSTDSPAGQNTDMTTENGQETTENGRETTENGQQTTENGRETTGQQETTTNGSEETTQTPDSSECPTGCKGNCPETEESQGLFVCPTGFRRHPQNCNLFYQCTQNPNSLDYSIVVFSCPNTTVYNEEGIMCSPPSESDQCMQRNRIRRFGMPDFMEKKSVVGFKMTLKIFLFTVEIFSTDSN